MTRPLIGRLMLLASLAYAETLCTGDAALKLDRCPSDYEVVPEFPCYDRTIPATRISTPGWKTPDQCHRACDADANCAMFAILIRDERSDKVGHCILFSYADVASGLTVQEGGNRHLKCAKAAVDPTPAPVDPTPAPFDPTPAPVETPGSLLSTFSPLSYEIEDRQNLAVTFATESEVSAFLTQCSGSQNIKAESDLTFMIMRDDSQSASKVTYYNLDSGKVETFVFNGGYADRTMVTYDAASMTLRCHGGRSSPSNIQCKKLPVDEDVRAIVLSLDLQPRNGAAHAGDWSRNKYTINGSLFSVECFDPPTPAPVVPVQQWAVHGRPGGSCSEVDCSTRLVDLSEGLSLRCCADSPLTNQFMTNGGGCTVYHNTFYGSYAGSGNHQECKVGKVTFKEGWETCRSMGARMCTRAEVEAGCVRNSGCHADSQTIWAVTSSDDAAVEDFCNFFNSNEAECAANAGCSFDAETWECTSGSGDGNGNMPDMDACVLSTEMSWDWEAYPSKMVASKPLSNAGVTLVAHFIPSTGGGAIRRRLFTQSRIGADIHQCTEADTLMTLGYWAEDYLMFCLCNRGCVSTHEGSVGARDGEAVYVAASWVPGQNPRFYVNGSEIPSIRSNHSMFYKSGLMPQGTEWATHCENVAIQVYDGVLAGPDTVTLFGDSALLDYTQLIPTDVDCELEWSDCNTACERTASVRVPQSGRGAPCADDMPACAAGEGSCPAETGDFCTLFNGNEGGCNDNNDQCTYDAGAGLCSAAPDRR